MQFFFGKWGMVVGADRSEAREAKDGFHGMKGVTAP